MALHNHCLLLSGVETQREGEYPSVCNVSLGSKREKTVATRVSAENARSAGITFSHRTSTICSKKGRHPLLSPPTPCAPTHFFFLLAIDSTSFACDSVARKKSERQAPRSSVSLLFWRFLGSSKCLVRALMCPLAMFFETDFECVLRCVFFRVHFQMQMEYVVRQLSTFSFEGSLLHVVAKKILVVNTSYCI